MTTVGFIGLGSMGLPMAKNLVGRGFTVRGFDMRRAVVEALAQEGGIAAASTADRKSTRLNSSHLKLSRMPSSA